MFSVVTLKYLNVLLNIKVLVWIHPFHLDRAMLKLFWWHAIMTRNWFHWEGDTDTHLIKNSPKFIFLKMNAKSIYKIEVLGHSILKSGVRAFCFSTCCLAVTTVARRFYKCPEILTQIIFWSSLSPLDWSNLKKRSNSTMRIVCLVAFCLAFASAAPVAEGKYIFNLFTQLFNGKIM